MKGCGSSSNFARAIINSLEDELMIINRDFRIIEVSETILSRHGKCRQEVIGEHCYKISHGLLKVCRLPNHECPVKTVWETGKSARATHVHAYYTKGEKRERHIEIIASPITDKQGNFTMVTEIMRDVTEAKETESKVTKAHQDLSALYTIANVVSQSLNLDTVLSSALDKTLEIMQQSTGGILLLDEESQTLFYRVHRGLSDRYSREMCLRLGEGIAGKVAQTGVAILVEDISTDPRAAHLDLMAIEGHRTFVCVPLRSKDRILGVLNIVSHEASKFSSEDVRLLESIAAQIAIAIENSRLHQEVRHKEEIRGELLQDMISLQEEERRRIARELHDETSQVLASLTASLEAAASMLPTGADKTKAILRKAQALAINILDEIHKLIYELRPILLDDLGLVAAIRWLTENNLRAAGITVNFNTVGHVRRLPPQLETALFRVTQEAIYNIAKHAQANNVDISLHFKKSAIEVHIKDDGRGFDVQKAMSSKDRPRGLGLLGMKERIELINGALNIRSRMGDGGTEINIRIILN